jgi:transposase
LNKDAPVTRQIQRIDDDLGRAEIAKRLGISAATAKTWRRAGLLRSLRYNDRGETLFEQPGPNTPIKYQYQRKNRANSMASAVGRNSINS